MTPIFEIRIPLLLAVGSSPQDDFNWVFFTHSGDITIENKSGILNNLLPLCNGTLVAEDLVDRLTGKYKSQHICDIIEELYKHKILCRIDRLYEAFYDYMYTGARFEKYISEEEVKKITLDTSLPEIKSEQGFSYKIETSTLGALAATRRTTYDFKPSSFTSKQLIHLFWSMYGSQSDFDQRLSQDNLTIPSGGGLYGLRLDLFLLHQTDQLIPGHYMWRQDCTSFEYVSSDYISNFDKDFFTPQIDINNALGVVTISADLDRVSKKYGNKSIPLTYLEAGHAMQNAYLFASQENTGFAEIFGFNKDLLRGFINSGEKQYYPLISGMFGSR